MFLERRLVHTVGCTRAMCVTSVQCVCVCVCRVFSSHLFGRSHVDLEGSRLRQVLYGECAPCAEIFVSSDDDATGAGGAALRLVDDLLEESVADMMFARCSQTFKPSRVRVVCTSQRERGRRHFLKGFRIKRALFCARLSAGFRRGNKTQAPRDAV